MMGTVELANDFELAFKDADSSFCHLKLILDDSPEGVFLCGQGSGLRHTPINGPGTWRETGHCDGCGRPICPDCLYVQADALAFLNQGQL